MIQATTGRTVPPLATPPSRKHRFASSFFALSAGRSRIRRFLAALRAVTALAAPLVPMTAHTANIVVGPSEALTRIGDAATVAEDGDVILILPGEYAEDVAHWLQKSLTIRGIGSFDERPVVKQRARNNNDEETPDTGLWVLHDGAFLIENLQFEDARNPDGNRAAIRLQRGRLEVRGSAFSNNQHAIATDDDAESELVVHNSIFANAPRPNPVPPHLLNVGRIARFELVGSHVRGGYEGHLVKSRARESEIRYNMIYDGADGGSLYELDFPNGGSARVVGNVIGQADTTHNPIVISYGEDGPTWAENRLHLAHNTLVSAGLRAARFLQVWDYEFSEGIEVQAFNNLTVGLGAFTLGVRGTFSGNYPLPPGLFDPGSLDFTLGPRSLLRGRVEPLPSEDPLRPRAEFALPAGTIPQTPPAEWVPGAFQSYNAER